MAKVTRSSSNTVRHSGMIPGTTVTLLNGSSVYGKAKVVQSVPGGVIVEVAATDGSAGRYVAEYLDHNSEGYYTTSYRRAS